MDPDPLQDPRCLVTTEALVVDGANGVCRDARVGDASVLRAASWIVGAALVVAWWRAERLPRRRRVAVVVALATMAALPGWYALLAVRADSPSHVAESARDVHRLHDGLRDFARRHGCAEVTVDACTGCAPIARLALSDLICATPASIELHEDALEVGCLEHEARLVCGTER
ncbi:MAG: hypothetical protein K1X94_21160 [Sandaracinaceae bacterium]|nr:hypothetical protein [Sandaracinaceae bacterium]